MERSALVTIRDYSPNDWSFILATWLRGLYYGDSWFKEIPKDIFMSNYHSVLEKLLKSGAAKVKVACLKDDPEVILAYAVMNHSETTLHWVFSKSAWRSIGIAKSLIPENIDTVTHLTKVGLNILRKHPRAHFNPFALT